jgi:hypothetical protein
MQAQNYLLNSMIKSQTGFVPQLSTKTITEHIKIMKQTKSKTCYLFFIDIKTAFDSAPREITFNKLIQKDEHFTPYLLTNLWKIFIKSSLDYGHIIFRFTSISTQRTFTNLYKTSLKISSESQIKLPTNFITGTIPSTNMEHRLRSARDKWINYLSNSPNDETFHSTSSTTSEEHDLKSPTWVTIKLINIFIPPIPCPNCHSILYFKHLIQSNHALSDTEITLLDKLKINSKMQLVLLLTNKKISNKTKTKVKLLTTKLVLHPCAILFT